MHIRSGGGSSKFREGTDGTAMGTACHSSKPNSLNPNKPFIIQFNFFFSIYPFGGSSQPPAHGARDGRRLPPLGRTSCTARSGKLYRARSRLYRSQILQVNIRLKALAEIYTMRSFAQLQNHIFFKKVLEFCQNFAKKFRIFAR